MMRYYLLMLVFLLGVEGYAQPPETKLVASNGDSGDKLALSTAISDIYAIAGAPEDEPNGAKSGSVYFYELVGGVWVEKQNVIPGDGSADDQFGYSVTIDGEWAAVGARFRGPTASSTDGKVYIYKRNGSGVWSEFTSFTLTSLDHFGTSVSLDGDYLAVGGVNAIVDYSGTLVQCGTVVIYRYNGSIWAKQTEIAPSDGAAFDEFGHSVAIHGNRLAVGTWKADVSGQGNAGAVYMFSRVGSVWTQDVKLTAFDYATDDNFGHSVSVYDDKLAVGAHYDDGKKGAVYFYKETGGTWGLSNKATASNGSTFDYFGSSVDFIKANHVIVGAEKHRVGSSRMGAAYLFEYNNGTSTWSENTTTNMINATDGSSNDYYGKCVAGDGDYVFVGAFRSDPSGVSSAGAGYFYDISASVLPVELISFDAKLQNNGHVLLDWATATETNNDGFRVQRSIDGHDWEDIGWVAGVGDSKELVEYSFMDRHPNKNINYYRLNQIDYDGENEYSEIESVFIKIKAEFTVFPNPTSNYIHLAHNFDLEDIGSIQLFDVLGRQVKLFAVSNAALNVADLPKGQYYLVLEVQGEMLHKSILIE